MRVALTGTPGTGKTTVARRLAERGAATVVHLHGFAQDHGLLGEQDEARAGARVVDVDDLADAFDAAYPADAPGLVVAEGHFAHELDADLVVLLRARPRLVESRLRARDWPEAKVRENVEAEALDVIAAEVADAGIAAVEVDVTTLDVDAAADAVLHACRTRTGPPPGTAAWDLTELGWL